jgi:proteasome lid subunit RPN8/RPN11
VRLEKAEVSSSASLAKTAQEEQLKPTRLQGLVLPSIEVALQLALEWGIEGAPEEVCGILVNETQGVRLIQLQNRAPDRTAGYLIDQETMRTLALKPKTWSHVAVWHTHPSGHVGPSEGDLAHKIHNITYVVISIPTGEVRWF